MTFAVRYFHAMPLMKCSLDSKPGWKFGASGTCYPYTAGDDASEKAAKKKAIRQALAIGGGKPPPEGITTAAEAAEAYAEWTEDGFELHDEQLAWLGDLELAATPQIEECDSSEGGKGHRAVGHDVCHAHDGTAKGRGKAKQAAMRDAIRKLADDAEPETVDILGVDVLAAGGPYFGKGSPEAGDFFDDEYLQRLADDTNEAIAAGELGSPVRIEPGGRSRLKLGHGEEQTLLRSAGMTLDDGETPAAGWQENFRVEDGRLRCDFMSVPKKVAKLIKSKAFRKRSVEIKTLTSQTDPEKKLRVVVATALLGAKAPAVRTLDDILALYAEGASAAALLYADEPAGDGVERAVELAAGDVVWDSSQGMGALRDRLNAALNGNAGGSVPYSPRYWVMDVMSDGAGYRGLVQDYSSGSTVAWIAPFTLDADGDVHPAPISDWTMAEQAWVESAGEYEFNRGCDTSPRMSDQPETPKLSDEQVVALAAAFSITESDEAKRRELVEAKVKEYAAGETDPPPPPPPVPPPPAPPAPSGERSATELAEIEVWKAKADRGDKAFEELESQKIETAKKKYLDKGVIDPAKVDLWERSLAEDYDRTIELLETLPVNEEFKRVYGVDSDGLSPDDQASAEDRLYAELVGMTGGPAPSLAKASA